MAKETTIAQLDRQITINQFVFGQDESGGNVKALVSTFDIFASFEIISNSYLLQELQLKYGEGYKGVVRYEPSRILTPNDEIFYQNRVHKIQSIGYDNQAQKRFVIIIAKTSNSGSNSGSGVIVTTANEYHYIGIGEEYSFQDDILKGWVGRILVFRDKINFRVVRTGTPGKEQVLYNSVDGTFTFSNQILPLATGETVDAYLLIP